MCVFMGTKWGGYATSSQGSMQAGYDPRKRSWYRQAFEAGGKTIMTSAYQSTIGEPVICVSKKIVSDNGDDVGCMSIEVSLSDLTDFIARQNRLRYARAGRRHYFGRPEARGPEF